MTRPAFVLGAVLSSLASVGCDVGGGCVWSGNAVTQAAQQAVKAAFDVCPAANGNYGPTGIHPQQDAGAPAPLTCPTASPAGCLGCVQYACCTEILDGAQTATVAACAADHCTAACERDQ